ncbi:MAG TPA: FKBP-type peptidyl-prolyl cis-trans isomerase [Pyrinomonadaceae bacterium]|nr:FKBP-type peptidyl-prolyl cis-trans isomerase [Pyrinomonadaceae bacterium]
MKIPKGLKISQLKAGSGKVAELGAFALIHYDCYLPRGERCESSRNQGFPVQLKVGERLTYPAIAYALPGMTVGEVRMVKVSPNLTYYERKQNPKLPPDVALRYEIELISLNDEWDNSVYRTSDETSLDKPLTNT